MSTGLSLVLNLSMDYTMGDNIKVRPSEGGVDVATDIVDDVHYPIYKAALGDEGDAELVSSANPIPTCDLQSEELLKNIFIQLKKLNMYMAMLTEFEISDNEIE